MREMQEKDKEWCVKCGWVYETYDGRQHEHNYPDTSDLNMYAVHYQKFGLDNIMIVGGVNVEDCYRRVESTLIQVFGPAYDANLVVVNDKSHTRSNVRGSYFTGDNIRVDIYEYADQFNGLGMPGYLEQLQTMTRLKRAYVVLK